MGQDRNLVRFLCEVSMKVPRRSFVLLTQYIRLANPLFLDGVRHSFTPSVRILSEDQTMTRKTLGTVVASQQEENLSVVTIR